MPTGLVLAGGGARGGLLPLTGGPAGGGAPAGAVPAPAAAPDDAEPAARADTADTTEILIRPAVSVIVCAFTEDRWDDICRVIGSLRTQTEAPGEVILVIDHCPPLLRRARQAFRDVTIVPNHFQKGLAGGRNTGVAHAWGDVVAFIDDDAVADPDWLTRLADHYLDPTVLGVGGLVEPDWEHGRPGWFPPELDWVVGCSYQGMRSGLGPVRNFIGANMSFRREILAEVGGFSIELGRVDSNPFGCEETELCLRVSQRYPDAILLYEPAAAVSHRVRKQRARWRYLRSRCYAEGRSKATVASLAGADSALASERSYVRSAIPRGVLRSLWQALRGRPSGLLAAFALVLAVFTTGFGYGVGRMSGRGNPAELPVPEDTGGEALDAEAWVLESDRSVPDEQTWVLDPDDALPAVDDWAGAGRTALNGHGKTLPAGHEMLVVVPQPPAAEPAAPPADPAPPAAGPQTAAGTQTAAGPATAAGPQTAAGPAATTETPPAGPQAPAGAPEPAASQPDAPPKAPPITPGMVQAQAAPAPRETAAPPAPPAVRPEAAPTEPTGVNGVAAWLGQAPAPPAPAAPPEARPTAAPGAAARQPDAPAAAPDTVQAQPPEPPPTAPGAARADPARRAPAGGQPVVPPEAAPTEPTGAKPVASWLARAQTQPQPPAPAVARPEAVAPEAVAPEAVAPRTAPESAAAPEELDPEVVALEVLARLAAPKAPVAQPQAPAGRRRRRDVAWWEQPPAPAKRRVAVRTATRAAVRVADLLLPWAGLVAVAALWVLALGRVRAGVVSTAGFGLVSALPVTFWVASGLLMVSFAGTVVRWPGRWPVLGAHLVALVVILHATPAIVYGTLRYSWAWKHVGVVDYIIHHGIDFNLGGVLGIYQGWPGFFALNAFLTGGGGLHSALSYASWALAANDLLWLGPVLLIARAFTADWRMIWAAAWVFELGNWVGQDYFSPQAFAFFLFLTIIAICLRWLGDDRPRRRWITEALGGTARWVRRHAPSRAAARLPVRTPARRIRRPVRWDRAAEGSLWYRVAGRSRPEQPEVTLPPEGAAVSRSMRLVLVAALVPLMVAIASSHQLTPIMVVVALGMLAVFRHLRPRLLLPLLALAIAVGWIYYGGLSWLQANHSQVFSGFGALWANSSAHIVGGGQVTPDQVIVEWGARLLSAAIGLMAMAGFLRYRRHRGRADRRSWNRVALLGVASIAMVAGNSYGGEIIFRAFLFALPFMAVAAAALFFPRPEARRRYLAGVALAVTTALLAAGYFLSNFGTDAMNYFTSPEVTAAQWLYRTAPAGAQVIAVNSNFPWAFVHYDRYTYTFLDGSGYSADTLRDPVQEVSFLMSPPYPKVSYLVFTRSQAAQEAISGPWSPGEFSRVYDTLMQSSDFRTVYLARGVTILRLTHGHHRRGVPLSPHPRLRHRHAVPHRRTAHVHHVSRALLRARRAYYARHHPPKIGGRPVAP